MAVGYACVSTRNQTTQLQIDALKAAKCKRTFVDQVSGRTVDRPKLAKCLGSLRDGDTLVIWKLDRLGHLLKDLIEIVERLRGDGI